MRIHAANLLLIVLALDQVGDQCTHEHSMADCQDGLSTVSLALCHLFEHLHHCFHPTNELLLCLQVIKSEPAPLRQNLGLLLVYLEIGQQLKHLGARQPRKRLASHVHSALLMDLHHNFTWSFSSSSGSSCCPLLSVTISVGRLSQVLQSEDGPLVWTGQHQVELETELAQSSTRLATLLHSILGKFWL